MTLRDIQRGGYPNSETPLLSSVDLRALRAAGKGTKAAGKRTKKGVDVTRGAALTSVLTKAVIKPPQAAIGPPQAAPAGPAEERNMTLTKKGLDRRGRVAIYTGAAVNVRIPLAAFPNKTAPDTISVADGAFAGPKQARASMTAEERKAARAAKPKPTLAEKIAAREAQLAKLREKAAAEGAAATM